MDVAGAGGVAGGPVLGAVAAVAALEHPHGAADERHDQLTAVRLGVDEQDPEAVGVAGMYGDWVGHDAPDRHREVCPGAAAVVRAVDARAVLGTVEAAVVTGGGHQLV